MLDFNVKNVKIVPFFGDKSPGSFPPHCRHVSCGWFERAVPCVCVVAHGSCPHPLPSSLPPCLSVCLSVKYLWTSLGKMIPRGNLVLHQPAHRLRACLGYETTGTSVPSWLCPCPSSSRRPCFILSLTRGLEAGCGTRVRVLR